ncbi:MAG TPA: hypothetical protein VFE17_06055 [Candidatus Baltobacteraceae bacterium]|nr:hypothetical protein [Candidatus Baltobacteraceae bacterium]
MQLFVLDDEYRITSRFDPPRTGPLDVPANSSRLPAGVETAVRAATLEWVGNECSAVAFYVVEAGIVVHVTRLSGPGFSGVAVRVERAAQMYPIG